MPDKRVLTDRTLKALKPAAAGKRDVIWDAACPGLAVRVTDKGTKSFYVIRRPKGERKLVNHPLGTYPAMSLADARRAAPDVLATLARGDRPGEVKRREAEERTREADRRRADSFGAVAEDFIRRHLEARKLRSAKEVASTVRRELVPTWGERVVTEITRREVIELIERIIDRRGRYAARHAFSAARSLFNWAVERGVIERSPCERIKAANLHGAPEARDRVLSEDELRLVWRAAALAGYPFGPLVRLLALTGQRRDELADLRWPEVDLDAALLTIPAERMKGKIAHTVPLTPAAVELFRDLPRFTGDYAFTTTGGARPVSGFSKMKARLDRMVGDAVPPWTLHDLRRTMRTGLASAGVLPVIAELTIGHRQQGIAAVYDRHRYDAEKRAALTRWEAKLLGIVGPGGGGNVFPIRARAR
jgi:integrase